MAGHPPAKLLSHNVPEDSEPSTVPAGAPEKVNGVMFEHDYPVSSITYL